MFFHGLALSHLHLLGKTKKKEKRGEEEEKRGLKVRDLKAEKRYEKRIHHEILHFNWWIQLVWTQIHLANCGRWNAGLGQHPDLGKTTYYICGWPQNILTGLKLCPPKTENSKCVIGDNNSTISTFFNSLIDFLLWNRLQAVTVSHDTRFVTTRAWVQAANTVMA